MEESRRRLEEVREEFLEGSQKEFLQNHWKELLEESRMEFQSPWRNFGNKEEIF